MMLERRVDRISVNPQTFSDETLARVGRAHTGEDTVRAYQQAREMGFQDINMDLIGCTSRCTSRTARTARFPPRALRR